MTSYQSVDINMNASENKSRSRQWSSQSCVNMYQDRQSSGRSESALMSWPGELAFSTGTAGTRNRGMHVVGGVPYVLIDRNLYKVSSDGTQTLVGEIPGTQYVSFADDGFNLVIRVSGTAAYINGKFILQGPGESFFYDGSSIRVLSTQVIQGDEFLVSDVDLPETYKYSPGKSNVGGGTLKQVSVFQQKIFMAGNTYIDVYFDDQEGNPPIKAVQQASTSKVGVASSSSIAQTPNFLYLLGSDGVAYRVSNFELQSITTTAVGRLFREKDTSDALGVTCQLDGQWFYILQLRGQGLTLAYSEMTGEWIRLSTGVNLGAHLMNGYAFAYGKHLICDSNSSDVYEWDFYTYTSLGDPIIRQFETAPLNGQMIGAPGKRLLMSRCRFYMENGVGNADEADPIMRVEASLDGGTFTNESWIDIERAGDSASLVDWYQCLSFYDIYLRVRVSDPVFTSFHGITMDIRAAGD